MQVVKLFRIPGHVDHFIRMWRKSARGESHPPAGPQLDTRDTLANTDTANEPTHTEHPPPAAAALGAPPDLLQLTVGDHRSDSDVYREFEEAWAQAAVRGTKRQPLEGGLVGDMEGVCNGGARFVPKRGGGPLLAGRTETIRHFEAAASRFARENVYAHEPLSGSLKEAILLGDR